MLLTTLLEDDGIEVEIKSFELNNGIEELGPEPFVRILPEQQKGICLEILNNWVMSKLYCKYH